MKIFSCSRCQQIVFFESVRCTACGHALAYLPDRATISTVEATATNQAGVTVWRALAPVADGALYRSCKNSIDYEICNWAIPAEDPGEYCRACRLNEVIPDLSINGANDAWHRLEIAKRRLLFTLMELGLPMPNRNDDPKAGLTFEFLADPETGGPPVLTGHADGVITINIAEADDPFREKMRVHLGETYRTVLGHFRHEIGHYYWDRLIPNTKWLPEFRARFGDEQASYDEAMKKHYSGGPPADWPESYVSSYASMHPWEDWAETWAHYLHMVDTLETARTYGLSLRPTPSGGGMAPKGIAAGRLDMHSFEDLLGGWVPLTLALNSLNQSMGLKDGYPFVLSTAAIEKLRFVHEVVVESEGRS